MDFRCKDEGDVLESSTEADAEKTHQTNIGIVSMFTQCCHGLWLLDGGNLLSINQLLGEGHVYPQPPQAPSLSATELHFPNLRLQQGSDEPIEPSK